jgi:hypothetical protein
LDNNSGATQFAAPHYVFYNNLTVNASRNQTYTLTITHDDGTSIHGIAAWIDFNGDSDFDDANEKVGQTLWPGDDDANTGNTVIYSVTIPATAVLGTTRMRVRIYEDDDYTFSGNDLPVLPCQYNGTDYDWGETEDYKLVISSGSASINENKTAVNYTFDGKTFNVQDEVSMIQLIGLNGQVIIETKENRLDVSAASSGIYIVNVVKQKGESTQVKIAK